MKASRPAPEVLFITIHFSFKLSRLCHKYIYLLRDKNVHIFPDTDKFILREQKKRLICSATKEHLLRDNKILLRDRRHGVRTLQGRRPKAYKQLLQHRYCSDFFCMYDKHTLYTILKDRIVVLSSTPFQTYDTLKKTSLSDEKCEGCGKVKMKIKNELTKRFNKLSLGPTSIQTSNLCSTCKMHIFVAKKK